MKNFIFFIALIPYHSLYAQVFTLEKQLPDTSNSHIEVIDKHNRKQEIFFKEGNFTCGDIRKIIKKCCTIEIEDITKTCSGHHPRYYMILKKPNITINLYTKENYVFDYIKMDIEAYKRLFLKAHVYRIETLDDHQEHIASSLEIKFGNSKTCSIKVK